LDQNIGLVLAKAVLGLVGEGVDYRALVRDAVLFGARNRDGWGIGLTIPYCTWQPYCLLTRGSLRPGCVVGYLMGEGWVHT
jgi:hypothetical protein